MAGLVGFEVPKKYRYKEPLPPTREHVDDDHLIGRLLDILQVEQFLPPETAWMVGVVAVTGCRANEVFSIGTYTGSRIIRTGEQIRYWCAKRQRCGSCGR